MVWVVVRYKVGWDVGKEEFDNGAGVMIGGVG